MFNTNTNQYDLVRSGERVIYTVLNDYPKKLQKHYIHVAASSMFKAQLVFVDLDLSRRVLQTVFGCNREATFLPFTLTEFDSVIVEILNREPSCSQDMYLAHVKEDII